MISKFGSWYMRHFGVRAGRAFDLGGGMIALAIGLLIMAVVIPLAITSIETANTSGWSANTKTVWGILGIVVVAVVIFGVYKKVGGGKRA